MSNLHATRKQLIDALTPLSKEQLRYKPGPDRWSAGEIAEHLILVEGGVYQQVQGELKKPVTPDAKQQTSPGKDAMIQQSVPNRTRKVQAPEGFRPGGKYDSAQAAIEDFKIARDRTIEFVQTTQADLRGRIAPHPALGPMDLYQWVLFLGAHTERHLGQLREVLADSKFPR